MTITKFINERELAYIVSRLIYNNPDIYGVSAISTTATAAVVVVSSVRSTASQRRLLTSLAYLN